MTVLCIQSINNTVHAYAVSLYTTIEGYIAKSVRFLNNIPTYLSLVNTIICKWQYNSYIILHWRKVRSNSGRWQKKIRHPSVAVLRHALSLSEFDVVVNRRTLPSRLLPCSDSLYTTFGTIPILPRLLWAFNILCFTKYTHELLPSVLVRYVLCLQRSVQDEYCWTFQTFTSYCKFQVSSKAENTLLEGEFPSLHAQAGLISQLWGWRNPRRIADIKCGCRDSAQGQTQAVINKYGLATEPAAYMPIAHSSQ